MSDLVPVFLDLAGRRVLVTGTAPGALSAARRLAAAGARVTIVARTSGEASLPEGCALEQGMPSAAQVEGTSLVVAGSQDAADDAAVIEAARSRGVPCVDLAGSRGSAHLGTALSRGAVALAVTTSGASPELEARVLADAAPAVKDVHVPLVEILASIRQRLEDRFPDDERRAAIWEQILDSPVMVLLESGDEETAREMAERMAWGTG